MNSKKVVLAGGVFDIIHPGHIHTLNAAKALGDVPVSYTHLTLPTNREV